MICGTKGQFGASIPEQYGVQVRLNMTHSDHAWHEDVINKINDLNKNGFNIAVMVDTEGSEAHLKAADPVRVEVRHPTHSAFSHQQLTCCE